MGRIYKNCKEAINEIERDLVEMGTKVNTLTMQNKIIENNDDYETKEVQNYNFAILDTSDKDDIVTSDLEWCRKEFEERISSDFLNPGTAWKLRAKVWSHFMNNDLFDYTYNNRLNQYDQIQRVIRILQKDQGSRHGIITIWYPEDIVKSSDFEFLQRVPCSIYYQLMIRKGKLDIIYNMRSSDFATHFKNDIWLADEMRKYIAKELNIETGIYYMNIGSLHIYKGYGGHKHVF
jgi:thymidylate synthase